MYLFILAVICACRLVIRAAPSPALSALPVNVLSAEQSGSHPPLKVRFNPTTRLANDRPVEVYAVEICGSVFVPDGPQDTDLLIRIADITDGPDSRQPILTDLNAPRAAAKAAFCRRSFNGTLPAGWSVLSKWTTVATFDLNSLYFARRGPRTLALSIAIVPCRTQDRLAWARSTFVHHHATFGYLDVQENRPRIARLAAALARKVAVVQDSAPAKKRAIIAGWQAKFVPRARRRTGRSGVAAGLNRWLNRLFRRARPSPWRGPEPDIASLCQRLVEISVLPDRHAVLELCMQVAAADGCASSTELTMLRQLAEWLGIDLESFRTLAERRLPVMIHQQRDPELLLGITPLMDRDSRHRQLSREYRKWNGRVTHSDKRVRTQAAIMLDLIADARADSPEPLCAEAHATAAP